ncbi:MAG: transposase [Candidatus Diapherotrites archaeon]|nr:transposase [Candidatus Diapherotrites archaeon]
MAKKIAEYAIRERTLSSKDVKHIGLKSVIANQILRKYAKNKTIKTVNSVKLTVPSQGIRFTKKEIIIPCLKLTLPIRFNISFKKINQVEIGETFAYVSYSYEEPCQYKPKQVIGVDRNTIKHVLVASNIDTGKVLKLGKKCNHIHTKYKNIRRSLQKNGKHSLVKKIKDRESRIIRNINHQISKKLIDEAQNSKAIIVLEELKDIRKTTKMRRKQRYSINSWSFYQLQKMIEYKSKKFGVPVAYVEPQYTSQRCSKCGHIEARNRKLKEFHCTKCGVVENADANAGFNIASLYRQGISRFSTDRDVLKGSTDTPKGENIRNPETPKLNGILSLEYVRNS